MSDQLSSKPQFTLKDVYDEADLCRNDGVDGIADLLAWAGDEIERLRAETIRLRDGATCGQKPNNPETAAPCYLSREQLEKAVTDLRYAVHVKSQTISDLIGRRERGAAEDKP